MTNDWMIDVLADLRVFAGNNGLHALETKLGETIMVATREIASQQIVVPFEGRDGNDRTRGLYRAPDAMQDA